MSIGTQRAELYPQNLKEKTMKTKTAKLRTNELRLEDFYTREEVNAAKHIIDAVCAVVGEIRASAGGDVKCEMELRAAAAKGILGDRASALKAMKVITRREQ
jgi:hypothetical protein